MQRIVSILEFLMTNVLIVLSAAYLVYTEVELSSHIFLVCWVSLMIWGVISIRGVDIEGGFFSKNLYGFVQMSLVIAVFLEFITILEVSYIFVAAYSFGLVVSYLLNVVLSEGVRDQLASRDVNQKMIIGSILIFCGLNYPYWIQLLLHVIGEKTSGLFFLFLIVSIIAVVIKVDVVFKRGLKSDVEPEQLLNDVHSNRIRMNRGSVVLLIMMFFWILVVGSVFVLFVYN